MNEKKRPVQQDDSLAAQLTRWRKLVAGVQRHLGVLAYTAEHNTQLEMLADEILHSASEQRVLTHRLRALVRERGEKVRQARELRNRLAAAVMGHYGPCSDNLREFGLKPRKRRRVVVAVRGWAGGRGPPGWRELR